MTSLLVALFTAVIVSRWMTQVTGQQNTLDAHFALTWNELHLKSIQINSVFPPLGARNLAMMHDAMMIAYTNVNAVSAHVPQNFRSRDDPRNLAITHAAYVICTHLYPGQQSMFDLEMSREKRPEHDGFIRIGRAAAYQVLSDRLHDGSAEFVPHVPGRHLTSWRPTGPHFTQIPQGSQFASTKLFSSRTDCTMPPPPEPGSPRFRQDYQEVFELGRINSAKRTQDQTEVAFFWKAAPGETNSPPGQMNSLAQQIIRQRNTPLPVALRALRDMNVAQADAGICVWKNKFLYDTLRPITAFTEMKPEDAQRYGIPYDPSWRPLIATPNFQEYPSGHSTFGSAAGVVLQHYFGNQLNFDFEYFGKKRFVRDIEQVINERGRCRIFGGIHFEFGNVEGINLGRRIAQAILRGASTYN